MDSGEQEVVVGEPDQGGGEAPAESEVEAQLPPTQEQLLHDLEQTRADYLRLAADFENYKRRRAQEVQELTRYGSAGLLRAILPALDNLGRAVSHIPADAEDGLAEGLRLTLRQLEEGLRAEGVERIVAEGEPFDPRLHEAVATVPDSGRPEGTVVAEYLPGYRVHDRVVRAAQVAVAGGPSPAAADGGGAAGETPGEVGYGN